MRTPRAGFTLIELLLTVAILAVLAGIVFVVSGPARERARETLCLSNLRQLGRAYQMYMADHDGREPEKGARTQYYELGLPSDEDFTYLVDTYLRSRAVLFCPSYHGRKPLDRITTTYTGYTVDPNSWADLVAQRGPDLPLWRCEWHNPTLNPIIDMRLAPRWSVWRFNILRLGGQVQTVRIPGQSFDPWQW